MSRSHPQPISLGKQKYGQYAPAPETSWWLGVPREQWPTAVAAQAIRCRFSRFGFYDSALASGRNEPDAMEAAKRKAAREASA